MDVNWTQCGCLVSYSHGCCYVSFVMWLTSVSLHKFLALTVSRAASLTVEHLWWSNWGKKRARQVKVVSKMNRRLELVLHRQTDRQALARTVHGMKLILCTEPLWYAAKSSASSHFGIKLGIWWTCVRTPWDGDQSKGSSNPLNPSGHYMYRQFNTEQFYVLPTQCICVFCVDLRTKNHYFPIQH